MKMEFAQMQKNMEDRVSKILAETKKAETMNNAIPSEVTSQTSVVKSDFGICIDGVYSEKASILPIVEAIEEEPFLLEEYEVSQTETDEPSISMLNKFPPPSNIGVNAKVKTIERQSCVERNSDGECSDSVEIFLDAPAASDAIIAFKVGMQVDFLLKAISDMVSQEFKSMRQDMKIEFAKVQENMEDMVSKILAETKKAEIINNPIPINKMSQALDVASDIGICIKEVYSQNASVLPLVDAIKEEPLLLQHWEVSEMDDPSMSMSNKFSHQSEIGVNAVVKTVKPQTCMEEDHSEKASVYPQFDVIEEEPLLLQNYADLQTETDDPNISILNKLTSQSEIGVKATVKTIDTRNCTDRSSDEEFSDSVEMFFDDSATNDRNNACKIQTQMFVGNNKEKRFSASFVINYNF
ncbi:unnamed protein product [Clavelina lepadiformis]|uniref:Uncharacterized protein n=1 Tax=Clavelina lepadiformis TaxID=159417 RepID=A0ABP0GL32_CLALP